MKHNLKAISFITLLSLMALVLAACAGASGAPGGQGEPGLPGISAKPGLPGVPGISGKPGLPGNPGKAGAPGLPGNPGPAGPQGIQGSAGPAGEQGPSGLQGSAGPPSSAFSAAIMLVPAEVEEGRPRIKVFGLGWQNEEAVTVEVYGPDGYHVFIGGAVADSSGAFEVQIRPRRRAREGGPLKPGLHGVVVRGSKNGGASAILMVTAKPTIVDEFSMVENPTFVNVTAGPAAGSGEIEGIVVGKSDFQFEMKVDATKLRPNTVFAITASVRAGQGPPVNPADASIFVGPAYTDSSGTLHFEGRAVFADVFKIGGGDATKWRVDYQIRLSGSGEGKGGCTDCVLVCSPPTKIEKDEDGNLVLTP